MRSTWEPAPRELTGRRGGLYDLFGRETRRLTREQVAKGRPGVVIGVRYLGPGIGRWFFGHSYPTVDWTAVDVSIDGVVVWRFNAATTTRPILLEIMPGRHTIEVTSAYPSRRGESLAQRTVEVRSQQVVEIRLHPARGDLSPHIRQGTLTTRTRQILARERR